MCALQSVEQCIVVRVINRGGRVVHNDRARCTHPVLKAKGEKEHVYLFRINRELYHI